MNLDLPDGHSVAVYDNGGETFDRYSVIIRYPDGYAALYGMSENPHSPQGFNQFCGEMADSKPYPGQYEEGDRLGRKLDTVPDCICQAVLGRVEANLGPPCDRCGEPCESDEGLQGDSPRCEGCIDRHRDFFSNPYDA